MTWKDVPSVTPSSSTDSRFEFNAPRYYDFTAAAAIYGGVVGDTNPPLTEDSYADDDEVNEFFEKENPLHETKLSYEERLKELKPLLAKDLWINVQHVKHPPLKPWELMLREEGMREGSMTIMIPDKNPESDSEPRRFSRASNVVTPTGDNGSVGSAKRHVTRTDSGSEGFVTPTLDEIRSGRRLRRASKAAASVGSSFASSERGGHSASSAGEKQSSGISRLRPDSDNQYHVYRRRSPTEHGAVRALRMPSNSPLGSDGGACGSLQVLKKRESSPKPNLPRANPGKVNPSTVPKRVEISEPQRKGVATNTTPSSPGNGPRRRKSVAIHLNSSQMAPHACSGDFKTRKATRKSAPLLQPLRVAISNLDENEKTSKESPKEIGEEFGRFPKSTDSTSLRPRRDNRNTLKPKRAMPNALDQQQPYKELREYNGSDDASNQKQESGQPPDIRHGPSASTYAVGRIRTVQRDLTCEFGEKENMSRPAPSSQNKATTPLGDIRPVERSRGRVRFTAAIESRAKSGQFQCRRNRNLTLRKKIDEKRAENELAALLSRHNNNVNMNRRRKMGMSNAGN